MGNNKYEIGVYYFPNWHVDVRNEKWHGKGWTEWDLLKTAKPRYKGHIQPKEPVWGYEDESKPDVMEKKIKAAADHGVTSFIFDWYWYEDGLYRERALDQGFLNAKNNDQIKFSLMWANHDLYNQHPAQMTSSTNIVMEGKVSEESFNRATDHMIETYFKHPSYWKVEGGLYFSIFDIQVFIQGYGSIKKAGKVLDDFRAKVKAAGLGELHLNAIIWGDSLAPKYSTEEDGKIEDVDKMLIELGFNSTTTYGWAMMNDIPEFPKSTYSEYRDMSIKDYQILSDKYQLPYYIHVSMGWDSSPRTIPSDHYDNVGYPFLPILDGNTPEEFKTALEQAKTFLDKGITETKILTIFAWNEWTEGGYLEPDTQNKMAYLEAIREVFNK